jgi:hypothetical protein
MRNGDGWNKNRNEYDLQEGLFVKNKIVSKDILGFLSDVTNFKRSILYKCSAIW